MNKRLAILFTCVSLFHLPTSALAQANSWTNAASGHWEGHYWSLGVLPGTNQDILFTNEGWKALTIDATTAEDFPETMTVSSITISSPSNSYNTLLLNYSGTQTPLRAQYILVGSNSAMTMLSSALLLDGPNGTMEVGGEFNESDSIVTANQANVGSIGPGVYNMNSGVLNVSKLWLNGNSVFNQAGGTNNSALAGFYAGGTYNLSGGDFNATVYFNNGVFHQTGGWIDQPLTNEGTYLFDGGINYGGVIGGDVIQTGGTNFGGLDFSNGGTCVLSNGCSFLPDLNTHSTFQQFGGTQIVTNTLVLLPGGVDGRSSTEVPGGSYSLSGGTLTAGSMVVDYIYSQDGGTNVVTGGIAVTNSLPGGSLGLALEGGLLVADNITLTFGGGLYQTGGSLMVNDLTAYGYAPGTIRPGGYPDIDCLGGQLIVSNINVEDNNFAISTTNLIQTGTLTLASGMLLPDTGTYTFGPLMVSNRFSGFGGGQSVILLGTNVNCQIHFGDSSGLSWANVLQIRNWSGSIYGGGNQQIIFGSNSAALTAQQLHDIQFVSPPGMPPGNPPGGLPAGLYPARILATGEIVPDSGTPLPLKMEISGSLGHGAMPLRIEGVIGQSYNIEVSTDLMNWTPWTNLSNSNGSIFLSDSNAASFPQRFYRATVVP